MKVVRCHRQRGVALVTAFAIFTCTLYVTSKSYRMSSSLISDQSATDVEGHQKAYRDQQMKERHNVNRNVRASYVDGDGGGNGDRVNSIYRDIHEKRVPKFINDTKKKARTIISGYPKNNSNNDSYSLLNKGNYSKFSTNYTVENVRHMSNEMKEKEGGINDSERSKINNSLVKVVNDDLLVNISVTSLIQLNDTEGIDDITFSNWTNSLWSSQVHERSFKNPQWVEKGANICDNATDLIILMPANPEHPKLRESIRKTWASAIYGVQFPNIKPSVLNVKVVFIFAIQGLTDERMQAIKNESSRYKDIITADFVDSYRNLTIKTLASLEWASKYCNSAKYVLKADLDTFVNVPLLSQFLVQVSKRYPVFMLGHVHAKHLNNVMRDGKWEVSSEDYPFDTYPSYLLGHSYVITMNLIPKLIVASKFVPVISTEDAFITGILARIVKAPRLHHEGFTTNARRDIFSCKTIYNIHMTVTHMTASRLIEMWDEVVRGVCINWALVERRIQGPED